MSSSTSSSDNEELSRNIVLDIGSANIQAGHAGDDSPRCIFPNIVGKYRHRNCMIGCDWMEYYVGDSAQTFRGLLSLKYPMQNGVVTDWDAMEKVMCHTFYNELKVEPRDFQILVTEAANNPKKNRERLMEILFETFMFQSAYIALQPILAMYSYGRTSGLSVNIGDGVTQVLPIIEGRTKEQTWNRSNIAGSELTQYLMTLLNQRGNCFTTSAEYEIVREIKEKHCYVATDFDKEMQTSSENPDLNQKYELPDGQFIDIGDERFRCPEVLFRPDLIGSECLGIHELMLDSIMKCDVDIRKEICQNIKLSGGSTLFENIEERMRTEMRALVPQDCKLRCFADEERAKGVWVGGSIMASLSMFDKKCLSKQRYDEVCSARVCKEIFDMI